MSMLKIRVWEGSSEGKGIWYWINNPPILGLEKKEAFDIEIDAGD